MRTGLDHVAMLPVGRTRVDLGGYVSSQGFGASLTAEARINKVLSVFAEGYAQRISQINSVGAIAGVRAEF